MGICVCVCVYVCEQMCESVSESIPAAAANDFHRPTVDRVDEMWGY
jgi:hypothetical protein